MATRIVLSRSAYLSCVAIALAASAFAACSEEPCRSHCGQAGDPASRGGIGGGAGSAASGGVGGFGGAGGAGATGGAGGTMAGAGGSGGTSSGAGGSSGDAGDAEVDSGVTADEVWSPLTVMAVVDPLDHGAVGDGVANDLAALDAAVNALPAAGGIVFLREGKSFLKTDLLIVTKDHVKFWALNRQATVQQNVLGVVRKQSILCRNNTGCGFFGLKLRSDSEERFDALEDNPISADHGSLVEVVGCEIDGAAGSGIFLYGSSEHYIHGNFVHHTWADHIHHTNGARASWVFRNYIFNEPPSPGAHRGDDGVACVTYDPGSPLCGDMEWWSNTILDTNWGRGYSVIGGEDILIHDNWAIGVAGAGIIVASESSFDTESSRRITARDNVIYQCGDAIGGHPGILVSGDNAASAPLSDLAFYDNISVDNVNGPYREEGAFTNVINEGMRSTADALPMPVPTLADVKMEDTSVLRTRDVSHVEASLRTGLHRIHVRPAAGRDGFEQRFEYVVKGEPGAVDAFTSARRAAQDYVVEQRVVGGSSYALVLTAAPVAIGEPLSAVSFRDLRAGAAGELAWLWQLIDDAAY